MDIEMKKPHTTKKQDQGSSISADAQIIINKEDVADRSTPKKKVVF